MKLGLTLALIAVITSALTRRGGPPQWMSRTYRHENCDNEDRFEDCREKAAVGRANSYRYAQCIDEAFEDEAADCDGLGLCLLDVEDRFDQVENDWGCLDNNDSCGCP